MKQKDIALIVVVVFVSGIISFFVCSKIFGSPQKTQQKVEVVMPISKDFTLPDKSVFNESAIDPTQLIQIGGGGNNTPFNGL